MVARFFLDETDLALGKLLASRHEGVVYPGHSDLPRVPRGSLDDEWLPIIGDLALAVITRDKRIRYKPVEKRRWVVHRIRGFVLTGRRSQSTADSAAMLDLHWTEIESLIADRPTGPWMYAVTREPLREIHLV